MEWIVGFSAIFIMVACVLLICWAINVDEKMAEQKARETEIIRFFIERTKLESDTMEAYRAMLLASIQAESTTGKRQ